MARITEVAQDLFQITTFVEPFNLQFSQFLVRDDEPRARVHEQRRCCGWR